MPPLTRRTEKSNKPEQTSSDTRCELIDFTDSNLYHFVVTALSGIGLVIHLTLAKNMNLERHISHYFEREYGPLLSICDLDEANTEAIIEREREAETGFNRFSYGKDFFDFRKLADDLLLDLYSQKFGKEPERRPYYAVLGDSDVIGGLFRDPYKIRIPLDYFSESEITFMCPDHFHLVGLSKMDVKRSFGYQPPEDYSKKKYPYFGKLLTYNDLEARISELRIDHHLAENKRANHWHRYIEAQIWADPSDIRSRFKDWVEVDPESWTYNGLTHLQNYKTLRQNKGADSTH